MSDDFAFDEAETENTEDGEGQAVGGASSSSRRPKPPTPRKKGAAAAPAGGVQVRPCLCCPLTRKKGSRFCKEFHHPSWENMRGQAVNEDKCKKGPKSKAAKKKSDAEGKSQLEMFNESMADDEVARAEVSRHYEENVCIKKFAHRKLINWAEFNKKHYVKRAQQEGEQRVPYEKEEWILRQIGKMGRTRAQATSIWDQHLAGTCRRANDGLGGQVRLWLLKKEFMSIFKETGVEQGMTESSDKLKDLSSGDMDALLRFSHRGLTGHGDEFFRGESAREAREDAVQQARSSSSACQVAGAVDGVEHVVDNSDDDDDDAEKSCNLLEHRTHFYTSASQALLAKKQSITENLIKIRAALQLDKDSLEPSLPADVKARCVYVNSCKTRLSLGMAWLGQAPASMMAAGKVPAALEGAPPTPSEAAPPTPSSAGGAADSGAEVIEPKGENAQVALGDNSEEAVVVEEPPGDSGIKDQQAPVAGGSAPLASVQLVQVKDEANVLKHIFAGLRADEHNINLKLKMFFMDCTACEQSLEVALSLTSLADLNSFKTSWAKMAVCNADLEKGLKEATKSLSKHIEVIQNAATRAESKKRKLVDDTAIKEQQEKLQKTAKAIKEAKEQAAQQVPNLFATIKQETRTACAASVYDTPPDNTVSVSHPALIQRRGLVTDFLIERPLATMLTAFATSYKSKKGFDTEGKVQERLENGSGREQTQVFFDLMLKLFDKPSQLNVSSVAKSFTLLNFAFGYSSKHWSLAPTPNSCSMLMVLAAGSIEHFFFHLSSCVKACKAIGLKASNMEEVITSLDTLNLTTFDDMLKSGAVIMSCTQNPEDIVYVPMGWMHAQRVARGPVIYGVRKSVFFTDDKSGQMGYVLGKELLANSGRDVTKMEQIEKLFEVQ